jgi:hypothetical protein
LPNVGLGELLLLFSVFLLWLVDAVPAFVVGRRRGLNHAGAAFIPFVGPDIVILRSINRSGWLCILGLLPWVNLVFYIWLACVVPGEHRRSRWWIVLFLIPFVNLIAFFAYAFTLTPARSRRPARQARALPARPRRPESPAPSVAAADDDPETTPEPHQQSN